MTEDQIYNAIGEEGFTRLIAAFYRRVPGDDILGPLYPAGDLVAAEERLRDFLVGRFGGPMRYVEQRGHPRLRQRHAPFAIDERSRDRWIALMMAAMEEAAFPAEVHQILEVFFRQTADFLRNRPG